MPKIKGNIHNMQYDWENDLKFLVIKICITLIDIALDFHTDNFMILCNPHTIHSNPPHTHSELCTVLERLAACYHLPAFLLKGPEAVDLLWCRKQWLRRGALVFLVLSLLLLMDLCCHLCAGQVILAAAAWAAVLVVEGRDGLLCFRFWNLGRNILRFLFAWKF